MPLIHSSEFFSWWAKLLFLLLSNTEQFAIAAIISAETEMTPVLYEAILMLDGVIPEVLHDPPKYVLKVKYPPDLKIEFGTRLLPVDLKPKPVIREWYTEKDKYYVLVMTGMDEPHCENSTQFQYLYWCVGNIPETNISAGFTYVPYLAPRPKKNSELHRYVLVLYQQPQKMEFLHAKYPLPHLNADYDDTRRTCFSTRKFWLKNELTPWACNFFESEYNETLRTDLERHK